MVGPAELVEPELRHTPEATVVQATGSTWRDPRM